MSGGTFDPADTNLATVNELDTLPSISITYEEDDGFGGTTSYDVTLTPQEQNPNTITITNGDPASISGYYFDSFTNSLQYLKDDGTYSTTDKFEKIDDDALSEMVYYLADRTFEKVFTYIASAEGETKTYTITVENDWTPGKNSLAEYVSRT